MMKDKQINFISPYHTTLKTERHTFEFLFFVHSGVFHEDFDECQTDEDDTDEDGICGENAQCFNTYGSFYCQCLEGFLSSLNSVNFSADSSAVCRGR